MSEMGRWQILVAAAGILAGCGGGGSGTGAPSEGPGRAMVRLVQHELNGRLESSYAMLVKQQRTAIDHDLYVHCPPGPPRGDVRVLILGVRDELYNVPAIGQTDTKAVTYEMSIPDAQGHRMKISDTGHLIAQDGQWRWTLSQRSLSALLVGACP
jgi:hypothetical protein